MAVKLTSEGIQFPGGSVQERNTAYKGEQMFYNNCAFNGCLGAYAFTGGSDSWTVPVDTNVVTFHAWGGGGAGQGHCCQSCLCDITNCAAYGGWYSRKTIRKCDGDFVDGDSYSICYGDGGNANADGAGNACATACCDAPRGCASYVNGPGLSNFCAPGGRGGYNIYCGCLCVCNFSRGDSLSGVGLTIGSNVDFAHRGLDPEWMKTRTHCDCAAGYVKTGESYGLPNATSYYAGEGRSTCGCWHIKRSQGFENIAAGGLGQINRRCGGYICNCYGSPGRPGMIKIEWS